MRLLDVITSPWAITRDKLNEIQSIYYAHLKREKIDFKALEAEAGVPLNNPAQEVQVIDGVSIIPVQGVLGKKMNLFSQISGGASMQIIERQVVDAVNDEAIKAIVLDIDSPGGTVDGSSELANKIFSLRGQKPIVSFVSGTMASAAVWIGLAADRVFISSETAMTGSVGVIATHTDISQAEEQRGIKVTEIVSGKFKGITTEHKPLSKEGKEVLQSRVDLLLGHFVADLAKFKAKATEEIKELVGEAQIFIGSQGIDVGLVDGVSTFESLIKNLSENDGALFLDIKENSISGEKEIMDKNTIEEAKPMTAKLLAEDHPEVFEAIKQEGFQEGFKAGVVDGAAEEVARIKDVEENCIPGYESMVEKMKFDGKSTGGDVAKAIVKAEKKAHADKLDDIAEDSPDVLDTAEESLLPDKKKKKEVSEDASIEEKAEAAWENDESVRSDFGSKDEFIAWFEARENGQIKHK